MLLILNADLTLACVNGGGESGARLKSRHDPKSLLKN
jgi:hypothetical protein